MAVGDQAKTGVQSLIAYFPETTYGTFAATTTSARMFQPMSIGIKVDFETLKFDTLSKLRGYTHQAQMNKNVGGTVETFLHPEESLDLFINAMGGTYTFTSITAAGDHSISAGNFASTDTLASLSVFVRKGDNHGFRYAGGVINSLKLSASIGEPVKMSCDFVFKDASMGTGDALAGVMSLSTIAPLVYADGTYRYDATEGSLTSSVAEAIQSFELEINNNLVVDEKNRQLGSRVISGQPPALRREINFKISQRFDTTTTFNRMVENTAGAAALFFTGSTISAEYTRSMNIILPNIRHKNTDPVVEGADGVLQSETEFDVIASGNAGTSTSREIGITVRNAVLSKR